jgi:hypothetical protein
LAFRIALILAMSGALLFAQGKTSQADHEKCLKNCNASCQKIYDACKKNAKTDAAAKACKQSFDLCGSVCINKTCWQEKK